MAELLWIWVHLMNDQGDEQTILSSGETTDQAVAAAEERAGGTYTMNDWSAA